MRPSCKIIFIIDKKLNENLFEIIKNLPKYSFVILRSYSLPAFVTNDYKSSFYKKIEQICKKNRLKLFCDYEIYKFIKADGIHVPFFQKRLLFKFPHIKKLISLHRFSEIEKYSPYAEHFFFSPIFPSTSHPKNHNIINLSSLKKMIYLNKYRYKIILLGGINKKTLKQISSLINNVYGIAAIDYFTN